MSKRHSPKKSKLKLFKILVILLIIAGAIAALLYFARKKVTEQFATKEENTITSASVTVGEIGSSVAGSGNLSYEEASEIVIPQSVELTEVYVKAGQNVEANEMLASVNSASVVQAMADVQSQIVTLDEELAALDDDETSDTIDSTVDGRVKKIYVSDGDIVSNVMYENKALMLLSLDGKMAVDIETDKLQEGNTVTVKTSDGESYTGTVEVVWAGNATITITDNGPAYGDDVTVLSDDTEIGSGNLYIHQQLAVTGYTGTVSDVNVSENSSVEQESTLITLSEASNTVNYATLLEERRELEDTLQNLIVIYKEGAVYAKESGKITSYTESVAATSASSAVDTTFELTPTDRMVLTLSVDETDVLSLEIGQTAAISISALSDEETYPGEITDIDTVGSSSNGVTTYAATISLDRVDGMLNGMSATATISIEGKDNALLLPVAAISQTSSTAFVYTTYDEETGELGGMVEVEVGLTSGKYTEIVSGLKEGDTGYYNEQTENPWGNFNFGGGNFDFNGGSSGMPSGMPSGGSSGMPSGMPSGGSSGSSGSSGNSGSGRPSGMPSGFSGGMPGSK